MCLRNHSGNRNKKKKKTKWRRSDKNEKYYHMSPNDTVKWARLERERPERKHSRQNATVDPAKQRRATYCI